MQAGRQGTNVPLPAAGTATSYEPIDETVVFDTRPGDVAPLAPNGVAVVDVHVIDEAREARGRALQTRDGGTDLRVVAARFGEQLELAEVAEACGVSLATIKRRLDRALAHFRSRAAADPALAGRFAEGRTP